MFARRHACAARSAQAVRGFTLVECLTALSVAGVAMASAAPSFSGLMARQAVSSEVSIFEQGVRLTRSEAVKSATTVTLCAMDPLSAPEAPRCRAQGTEWSAGWVIFEDAGERGTIDADDRVLQVHQARLEAGTVAATLRYLSFQPIGISTNAASHFRFVPPGNPLDARSVAGSLLVCVNKPGRTRVLKADDCA